MNELAFYKLMTLVLLVNNGAACYAGLRTIKQYKKLHKMTVYLAYLCDEHEVPLSQFDIIAMTELGLIERVREG
jgi:hypothetical protein